MSILEHALWMGLSIGLAACGGHTDGPSGNTGAAGNAGAFGSSGVSGSGGGSVGAGGDFAGSAGAFGSSGTLGGAGTGGTSGDAGSPPPARLEIYGLAHGNAGFVATGTENLNDTLAHGVIYHSTNGFDWQRVATDLPVIPWDVAYGNDLFVAVGSHITHAAGPALQIANAYVSSDGASWMPVTLPVSGVKFDSAFGNGLFVAGGLEGHIRSSDGVSWTLFGPESISPGGGVKFAAGQFVSWSGTGAVWVTAGNDAGRAVQVDSFGVSRLHELNDSFVGVAASICGRDSCPASDSRWRAISSTNGTDWVVGETVSTEPSVIAIDDGSVCVAFQGTRVLSGRSCDALETTVAQDSRAWSALAAAGVYLVAIPGAGLLSSQDGFAWTKSL